MELKGSLMEQIGNVLNDRTNARSKQRYASTLAFQIFCIRPLLIHLVKSDQLQFLYFQNKLNS